MQKGLYFKKKRREVCSFFSIYSLISSLMKSREKLRAKIDVTNRPTYSKV